jgi:hypothetical protein
MHSMRLAMPLLAAALLTIVGCDNKTAENGPATDSTGAANTPKEVRIVKGENGPAYPDAKLTVISPAADEVVKTDSVMVKVALTGVDLTAPTAGEQSKGIAYSKEGQHIHVIIDDKPYMAMYKQDSFSVGKLAPGVHTLRAFPSRSWHESIKVPAAFVAHNFYVGAKQGEPAMKPNEPLLTYSRPKGDYSGEDAKRVLLDFYLKDAVLGPNQFKVVASIDGQVKDTLTEWIPYFIEGLTDGAHTVKLQLIGPDGQVVPGQFNTAERTININPAPGSTTPAPASHDTMSGMTHDTTKK